MIRIITIEREFGCGAAQVAEKLASRLNWKLWDQALTQEIARLANCRQADVELHEERRDPLYRRLLKSFALGSYEGNLGVYPIETLDADSIAKLCEKVVRRIADEGDCVIVGRGSQHFLQDRKDTLRFFLYAPREDKVQRLITDGNTPRHAEALVDSVDRERAAFIRNYFQVEWPNLPIYHAMVNTMAGDEIVVNAMLSFLKQQPTNAAA
ncbi:MAG TPA: cytidylate kinase-like family protein [Terriglobales bacterium]|nr:cytidylate kinase-like family protein [Terriglobales bacterium]